MRRIHLVTIAIAGLIAGATAAAAADFPRQAFKAPAPQVNSWTGVYLGVNAGAGMGFDGTSIAGTDANGQLATATGLVPGDLRSNPRGFAGGGQIGANWQVSSFVLGIEADAQYSRISGEAVQNITAAPLGLPIGVATSSSQELQAFGTLRGRLGFLPWQNVMLYGTGGGAVGHIKGTSSVALTAPAPFAATATDAWSDTKFGWTAGGGIEAALVQGWSVKAEYLYLDFGKRNGTMAAVVAGAPVSFATAQDERYHIVRVGLNKAFSY